MDLRKSRTCDEELLSIESMEEMQESVDDVNAHAFAVLVACRIQR